VKRRAEVVSRADAGEEAVFQSRDSFDHLQPEGGWAVEPELKKGS